jgi:hypothetical protein
VKSYFVSSAFGLRGRTHPEFFRYGVVAATAGCQAATSVTPAPIPTRTISEIPTAANFRLMAYTCYGLE